MYVSRRPHLPRPCVLLVEDDPFQARVWAAALRERFDVRLATSSSQALSQLDQDVEVVLADLDLPGRGEGAELLERIGVLSPSVGRVLMSARPDPSQPAETRWHAFVGKGEPTGALLRAVEASRSCRRA